jgi:hypothetical protein
MKMQGNKFDLHFSETWFCLSMFVCAIPQNEFYQILLLLIVRLYRWRLSDHLSAEPVFCQEWILGQ